MLVGGKEGPSLIMFASRVCRFCSGCFSVNFRGKGGVDGACLMLSSGIQNQCGCTSMPSFLRIYKSRWMLSGSD